MNENSNKNKPLSREELLRLLEAGGGQESFGDEPDDFEKDALEGFSNYAPAGKAGQLIDEIDTRIHEKLREPQKSRSSAKVVWLALAALLILVLAFSFYFLLQRSSDIHTELALNGAEKNKEDQSAKAPFSAPDQSMENQSAESQPATGNAQQKPVLESGMAEQKALRKNLDLEASFGQKEDSRSEKEDFGTLAQSATQLSKDAGPPNFKQQASDQKVAADGDQIDRNNKDRFATKEAVAATDGVVVQSVQEETAALIVSPPKEAGMTYESVRIASKQKASNSARKAADEKPADQNGYLGGNIGNAETDKASSADYKKSEVADTEAFFPGGEEAIKAYVKSWLVKKNSSMAEPKGSYHVKLTVLTDGKVKVGLIRAGYGSDEAGIAGLEKALSSMEGWSPARKNGKLVPGTREFDLLF